MPPNPPPATTTVVEANSALIVAPHFDDEVLGCGGLVTKLTAAGAVVRVVFCSDGAGESADPDGRRHESVRRREEARGVAALLGLAGIDELDLPDGSLMEHVEAMADGLARLLLEHRPELVFVPSPLEVSADHRAAFAALQRALNDLRGAGRLATNGRLRTLAILAYEVNHPLHPDVLVDVGAQVSLLERAMRCYASQQAQHDYLAVKLGLLKFRTLTLPPSILAAEAYRRLTVDDIVTRGPARLTAELGGVPELIAVDAGPTISLIVRTKDRPDFLVEALASVAQSTYKRLEVLVVNDGGRAPELPADYPLSLSLTNLPVKRGRAEAANAGIARARGDYVAFLDDDDVVEPEHFATLAGLVRGAGVRIAYTDAAVGIYELSPETGWRCVERRIPYSRDFDLDWLLFDNYIPFNTVLIERGLLAAVGELDAGLPIFEDWDLLIRLSEHAAFHHLPRVTCEYRHFRAPGHHGLGERPRAHRDFLTMKARIIDKHRGRITPEVTARMIDRLRAETVGEQERVERLQREGASIEREAQQRCRESEERRRAETGALARELAALTEQIAGLQAQNATLGGDNESLGRENAVLRGQAEALGGDNESLGRENGLLRGQAEALGREVRAMQASRAWRLAERWRGLRRVITHPRA
jgi:LmbE family N-acetylglucosaminyl deacetylase